MNRTLGRATKISVVALAVLGITGGAYAAVSAATVPAPTLTAKPANPTTATSASFSFTGSQSGVTYQCALDGATFAACTSPKSYPGPLTEAPHTFAVRARKSDGSLSSATTYTWRIDRTNPPPPTLTSSPANPTNETTASFSFTDAEPGVAFFCQLDGNAYKACTSPKVYPGQSAVTHTFRVKAVDGAGNTGDPTSFTWRIDRTPPPPPVIDSHPDSSTADPTATFTFHDAEAAATFRCQLDGGAITGCTSSRQYTGLSAASHTFRVQAADAAGNTSPAASYGWTVVATVAPVPMSGNLLTALSPGVAAPLNVRITNPYDYAIKVTGITVSVQSATVKGGSPNPGCDGTVNLVVLRQYSGPNPLVVGANKSLTLSGAGVAQSAWPQLKMPNLPVNQDACKGTTFTFN